MAVLLFIIFIFKRKIINFILLTSIGIYIFMQNNPFNEITVLQGSKIRILPTENSTIFYKIIYFII